MIPSRAFLSPKFPGLENLRNVFALAQALYQFLRAQDIQQNAVPQIFNSVLQPAENRGTTGGMSEIAKEYDAAVADLTFNSHPIINTLTLIAKENIKNANDIVTVIENRIKNNPLETKLPVIYLMDSIMKNVRGVYINLFAKNLFNTFTGVFARADAQMQRALLHLLQTWRDSKLFTTQLLQKIDIRVQAIQQKNAPTPAPATVKSATQVPPPYNKGPGRPGAPAPIPANVNKPMDAAPQWLGATPNTQVASAALTQPNLALALQGLLGQPSSVPTVNDLNNAELVLLLQVYQMMSQMNPTLKPVAEVTAVLPPGTPEMQRQHVVTTLQTIMAQQLQINPAQSPVILQTLQQLQQLYDLRATLQTTPPIANVVPTPTPVQSVPSLDPAALALLSGALSAGAGVKPTQPVVKPVQPVAPSRPVVNQSLSQDLMNFGLIQPNKGNANQPTAQPKRVVNEGDRPSFKNPESMRKRYEWVINAIYYDIPIQCSQCGLRFKEQKDLDSHMDWHFRKNRREKQKSKKPISRAWFQPVNAWIDVKEAEAPAQTITPFGHLEVEEKSEEEKKVPSVRADESQPNCVACNEKFELFWDADQEDWMYKNAVVASDGFIYHTQCHAEEDESDPVPLPTEVGKKREFPEGQGDEEHPAKRFKADNA